MTGTGSHLTGATVVPVQLDLRDARAVPEGPDGYLELWRQIESVIHEFRPREKDTYQLDVPQGRMTLRFIDPASAPLRLDGTTRFAVRGVVEPPKIRYRCAGCSEAGILRYGPFRCSPCRAENVPDRLCDDHAVIVDLKFGRVTCRRHRPHCRCGEAGSFWCGGPVCRGDVAWCDRHRTALPGDSNRAYCPDCYQRRFPACAAGSCAATGTMSCEYTGPAGRSCARRQCPRHGSRWQVYGPRRTGLAMCQEHKAALPGLTAEQLIRQVVVGTALRRAHGSRFRLPSLPALRYTLRNVRKEQLDIAAMARIVDDLRRGLADSPHAAVFDEAYQRAVTTALANHREGLEHFARLQRHLRSSGRAKLAEQVTFGYFTSRSRILYVRVPEALRGQFFGTGHKNVDALNKFLGLTVLLENS